MKTTEKVGIAEVKMSRHPKPSHAIYASRSAISKIAN